MHQAVAEASTRVPNVQTGAPDGVERWQQIGIGAVRPTEITRRHVLLKKLIIYVQDIAYS